MTMRNLMIAMMILIVLAAVTAIVSAANRPTVTVKIPYRAGTASAPTTRIVPAPGLDPGGTLFARTATRVLAPEQSPDN